MTIYESSNIPVTILRDNNYDFSWTLRKGVSMYADGNIKTYEYIDARLVRGFVNAKIGITYTNDKRYAKMKITHEDENIQIKEYLRNWDPKKKRFRTFYKMAKYGYGRAFVEGSLGMNVFVRGTRHRFAQYRYKDIDMQTCHLAFIVAYMRHHKMKNVALTEYLEDPTKVRNELIDLHFAEFRNDFPNTEEGTVDFHKKYKDIAKTLPIAFSNGGSYRGWKLTNKIKDTKSHPLMLTVDEELVHVIEAVWNGNPQMRADIIAANPEWKKPKNAKERLRMSEFPDEFEDGRCVANMKRSLMATWAQTIERMKQECAIRFLVSKGVQFARIGPAQDGLHLLEEDYTDKLEDEITAHVQGFFPFGVIWTAKPFDEPILNKIELADYVVCTENQLVDEILNICDHASYANYILQIICKDQFVCVNTEQNLWYQFLNHNWVEMKGAVALRREARDKIRERLDTRIRRAKIQMADLVGKITVARAREHPEKAEIQELEKNKKDLNAIINTMKSTIVQVSNSDYLTKSIRTARESALVFNPSFVNSLNLNNHLVVCNNGVFDLKTGIFRNGKPEDLMSISCGHDYRNEEKLSGDAKIRWDLHTKELMEFFEQIMVRSELRETLLDFLAYQLFGGNRENYMSFWIGEGSNGKSILHELFSLMMGDYATTVTSSFLTGKLLEIGRANPQMVQMRGKRSCSTHEAGKDTRLSTEAIKSLTSGDGTSCRTLNSDEQVNMKSPITCYWLSNNIPLISERDNGTWRRLFFINFESYFSKETSDPRYDSLDPTHFLANDELKEYCRNWIPALLGLLLKRVVTLKGKLRLCQFSKDYTQKIRFDQDVIGGFLYDCIDANRESSITHKELTDAVREWSTANSKHLTVHDASKELQIKYPLNETLKIYSGCSFTVSVEEDRSIAKRTASKLFFDAVLEDYEITGKTNDFVISSDFNLWAKDLKLTIQQPCQIIDILKTKNIVQNRNKKDRNLRVYRGIVKKKTRNVYSFFNGSHVVSTGETQSSSSSSSSVRCESEDESDRMEESVDDDDVVVGQKRARSESIQ